MYIQYLKGNNYELACELLKQCQQVAIEIGTDIERCEGQGIITVSYLEEYCEVIYKIYSNIRKIDILKQHKLLEKAIIKINNSIKYDIANSKPEMVFFPYKASMWDSLESIWLSAKKSGKYDCHVVPIPYYDKDKMGNFTVMHYEGKDFPDYVQIEAWEDYNIDNIQPDIAIIHNPYDNTNYVTSVHPDYYAKELKKKAGMLIYCPYFLSRENVKEELCVNPGIMYSDYVFVQSEHIRKQYIQYYNLFDKKYDIKGILGQADKKFIALGSPKIDKIRFFDKNDNILPEEWKELIKDKKIVLYNTHLSEVLSYGEKFFNKLKWVFDYFKTNKNYILWWRPHPLSKETILSIKPQMLQRYEKIVQQYKLENFGIYDDTPDVTRAIGYADIYYGSESSLVPMFGITGKPIIIHNINCIKDLGKQNLYSERLEYIFCTKYNNKLYMFINEINALVSFHIENKKWKLEAWLPKEMAIMDTKLYKAVYVNNKIYFFSDYLIEIFEYNLEDNNIKVIKLNLLLSDVNVKFNKLFDNEERTISNVINYNDNIIILPFKAKAISIYNKNVIYYTNWREKLDNILKNENDEFVNIRIESTCIINEYMYMIVCCKNKDIICCLSLENMELLSIYKPIEHGILFYMKKYSDNCVLMQWICENNTYIILWEVGKSIINIIDISQYFSQRNKRCQIEIADNCIYVFPIYGQIAVCIDMNENKVIKSFKWNSYIQQKQDKFYIIDYDKRCLNICKNSLMELNEIYLELPKELNQEIIMEHLYKNYIERIGVIGYNFKEKVSLLLPDILDIISKASEKKEILIDNKYKELFHLENLDAGTLIYKKIDELYNKMYISNSI